MDLRFLLLLPLAAYGCRQNSAGQTRVREQHVLIDATGKTIETRFTPPKGYYRKAEEKRSFGHYLRDIPLKPHGSPVLYYNGEEKANHDIYSGVVAMDIGKKDLQQCADAVMRLRAEYLYKTGQAKKIHFNFTSGYTAHFNVWMQGHKIAVKGNQVHLEHSKEANHTYESFRQYMELVFSYAGTLSLSKEMNKIDYNDLEAGDVLIQGGSPGHAVIVVDVAENDNGKKMYLLAQSYMPAQDIQILNNPMDKNISPWYELDTSEDMIETPQWKFTTSNLKRFRDQ